MNIREEDVTTIKTFITVSIRVHIINSFTREQKKTEKPTSVGVNFIHLVVLNEYTPKNKLYLFRRNKQTNP